MKNWSWRPAAAALVALSFSGAWAVSSSRAEGVDPVLSEQSQADKAASATQERIDEIQDTTQEMLAKYRQALEDAASLERYNQQLESQVKSQADTIGDMRGQLAEIETTQREVLPLMQRMIDTLERFVALDVPFLSEERAKRVDGLKALLSRADVTGSEKYRRILEAYQIEMDYGRTLEAYEGPIDTGGEKRTVQFVRVGRVALLYQTLDGRETGYWDVGARKWVRDDSYARDVHEALRVAKKQGAPDLLMVPVPAPEEAHS